MFSSKNFFVSILIVNIIIGTLSLKVYSEPKADYLISETKPEDPIAVLSSLQIIKGDENGDLKLDETITRAEYAVLINRIKGVAVASKYAVGTTPFSDVSDEHWACGHINVAYDMKIMQGYGNGKFGPEDELTYDQAVTILMRALGYEPFAKEKGGFPKGYLLLAEEKGILANTLGKSEDNLKRSTVFQLIFNSLDVKLLYQKTTKPAIYLYPTSTQNISVELDYRGVLTCTYPEYKDGWNVTANPDGILINQDDNKEYSYLFWEGLSDDISWDLSKGFVVKGEDTKDFLQDKLAEFGLTPREYNEFIVYWLPQMKDNKYNLICFAGEDYEDKAKLKINPKPDSILRVFMVYKSLDEYIEIEKQDIKHFERKGFTVIEWGGTEIQ